MTNPMYQVPEHMQSLVNTFTEMMTGEATPENVEVIMQWALYMHMRSVMPPLLNHWTQANPEDSAKVKEAIKKLQALNEEWKAKRKPAEG